MGALWLLTLATLRLPDVALYGELLHSNAGERRACCLVAQTLIGAASGAMRLAHRALEMHAVEVGYRTDRRVARAVEGARDELSGSVTDDEGLPVALEQARLATLALTRATASTANDPMLVPHFLPNPLLGPHDPTTAVELAALVLMRDKGAPTGQPIDAQKRSGCAVSGAFSGNGVCGYRFRGGARRGRSA